MIVFVGLKSIQWHTRCEASKLLEHPMTFSQFICVYLMIPAWLFQHAGALCYAPRARCEPSHFLVRGRARTALRRAWKWADVNQLFLLRDDSPTDPTHLLRPLRWWFRFGDRNIHESVSPSQILLPERPVFTAVFCYVRTSRASRHRYGTRSY